MRKSATPKKRKLSTAKIQYTGQIPHIYGIWLLNIILSIMTLGIYSFWGRVRLRKYVASRVVLAGDPCQYTGTGGELFLGFIKGILFLFLSYVLLTIGYAIIYFIAAFFAHFSGEAQADAIMAGASLVSGALFVVFYYALFCVAIFSALRYRFSRVTWRGIRGAIKYSAFTYACQSIKFTILKILSLGLYAHIADVKLAKMVAENSYYGNARAKFHGNPESLWKINFITMLLSIPTLALSRLWYKAALIRHNFQATQIDHLRFDFDITGGKLLGFYLVNLLIVVCTLGIGMPYVMQRSIKLVADNLTIIGDINTSKVLQSNEELAGSGEGLNSVIGEPDFAGVI